MHRPIASRKNPLEIASLDTQIGGAYSFFTYVAGLLMLSLLLLLLLLQRDRDAVCKRERRIS